MKESEITVLAVCFIVGLLTFVAGFRFGYIVGNYNKEKSK